MPDKMFAPNNLATNEKLILLVKDYPLIYDSNKPRNNQMLKTTWANIATAMGDDAVNAEGWKSKWRNIKDSYMRKKRQTMGRHRPVYENHREWPFLGMLSFLDKHLSHRNKREKHVFKIEEEDDDSEAGCLVDIPDCERSGSIGDLNDNGIQLDEEKGSDDAQNQDNHGNRRKVQGSVDNEDDCESVLNSMDYAQEYGDSSLFEDPDGNDSFFRSCSRRMSKLSQQSQSLLRLQITQLFFNAENPDIPDLEITTIPQRYVKNNHTETG